MEYYTMSLRMMKNVRKKLDIIKKYKGLTSYTSTIVSIIMEYEIK